MATDPRPPAARVAVEVVVDPAGGDARGRSARGPMSVLLLAWRADDPLAVALTLTSTPEHPALPRGEWAVLRDFLRYGTETPTGDGEVRIRPDTSRALVWLELARGAPRPCCIAVDTAVMAAFLDETERHVPAGEERSEEAVDALIALLLDRPPG